VKLGELRLLGGERIVAGTLEEFTRAWQQAPIFEIPLEIAILSEMVRVPTLLDCGHWTVAVWIERLAVKSNDQPIERLRLLAGFEEVRREEVRR
jgi:hypothetical protein